MPPAPRRELQQQRARDTREAIVRAASEEFDRRGYAAASLSAILKKSGVTKGAFYFHFPSKLDLALAIVREQTVHWRSIAEEPDPADDPLVALLGFSDIALTLFLRSVEVRAALRLSYERPVLQAGLAVPVPAWEGIVGRQLGLAAEQGLLRPEVDIPDTAQVINAAMLGSRTVSEAVSGAADLAERVDKMWRLLLPALASPAWLAAWRASGWEQRDRPSRG